MTDRDEWVPWIEHDGKGCDPDLIGRYLLIQFRLSHDDSEGGKAGQVHYTEALVTELYSSIPEWDRRKFGEYAGNPLTGEIYGIADIERYRIRKPRGLTILEDLITDIPQPVEVDA